MKKLSEFSVESILLTCDTCRNGNDSCEPANVKSLCVSPAHVHYSFFSEGKFKINNEVIGVRFP